MCLRCSLNTFWTPGFGWGTREDKYITFQHFVLLFYPILIVNFLSSRCHLLMRSVILSTISVSIFSWNNPWLHTFCSLVNIHSKNYISLCCFLYFVFIIKYDLTLCVICVLYFYPILLNISLVKEYMCLRCSLNTFWTPGFGWGTREDKYITFQHFVLLFYPILIVNFLSSRCHLLMWSVILSTISVSIFSWNGPLDTPFLPSGRKPWILTVFWKWYVGVCFC